MHEPFFMYLVNLSFYIFLKFTASRVIENRVSTNWCGPPRNPSVIVFHTLCGCPRVKHMVVPCAAHGRRRMPQISHTSLRSVGSVLRIVPPQSVNFVRNPCVQVHILAKFHCGYDQVQCAGCAERTDPAGCHRYRTQRHTSLRSVGSVLRIPPSAERKLRPKSVRTSPHPG